MTFIDDLNRLNEALVGTWASELQQASDGQRAATQLTVYEQVKQFEPVMAKDGGDRVFMVYMPHMGYEEFARIKQIDPETGEEYKPTVLDDPHL